MLKFIKTFVFSILGFVLSCSAAPEQKKENIIDIINFENSKTISSARKSKNASIRQGKGSWKGYSGSYGVFTFQPFAATEMQKLTVQMKGDLSEEKENPADISAGSSVWVELPLQHIISNKEALADYSILRFSTYNPGKERVSYNFSFKDQRETQRPIPHFVTLEPGEEKNVEIQLQQLPYRPRVDVINRYLSTSSKNVNLVEIGIPFLSQNVEIYISNLELIREVEGGKSTNIASQKKLLSSSSVSQEAFDLVARSSMDQVFLEKSKFDFSISRSNKIYAAKNEQEALQVVIVPNELDLSKVKWSLSSFKNSDGHTIPGEVSMVGFVETTMQPRYYTKFNGWYPDPILDSIYTVPTLTSTNVLPLYIKADVPNNAVSGEYVATLSVETDKGVKSMDIELEVWDFELPVKSNNRFLAQFYRLNSMSQFMPVKSPENTFGQRADAETEKFENWMLKNRMQPGNIYAGSPPNWNVARLKDLVERGLNAVNLSYIRIDRKEADNFNEKEYWQRVEKQIEAIKKYIPKLEEAGVWRDESVLKYIFLFDEWPGNKSDIVFKTAKRLKEEFPTVSLITTMTDYLYGVGRENGDLIDIWVPHVDILQKNKMHIDHMKKNGKHFGWYLAVGAYAPYPNVWIENKVIESRLSMGALSYKYDTPLFVYWAVNRWFNNNPRYLEDGPKTKWRPDSYGTKPKNVANGEGSLFYARLSKNDNLGARPVSTLRSENLRDGLEDFEYYVLLKELYNKHGLTDKDALVSKEVIENVSSFTYDPEVLQRERLRIAKEILKYNR